MNKSEKISLTAFILTYNEELHLERCLTSVSAICKQIVIIDSFSTDNTEVIAKKYNAKFYQNKFINHASQINWGLSNAEIDTEWVIRIDADEYMDEELKSNLASHLEHFPINTHGIRIKRLMYFLDEPIKRGGMYPIWHLRIWRNQKAQCEQRWMDERMVLKYEGDVKDLEGNIVDYNLNDVTWWTQKHNHYATKECIDTLDKIFNFTNSQTLTPKFLGRPEERRRWFKMLYFRLPLFLRPFLFFVIRYFFQLGFIEGRRGLIWNLLQCFWYRLLVDVKIFEVYIRTGRDKKKIMDYYLRKYNIDVSKIN